MVKKNCTIVGIEVRKTTDQKTQIATEKYYVHATHLDANMLDGVATFSAKCPDELLSRVIPGEEYDIAYRSFNGWNTVEGFYRV